MPTHRSAQLGWHRVALAAVAVLVLAAVTASPASAAHTGEGRGVRDVLFVANNWEGTADAISAHPPFERLGWINIIPDIDERMAEIATDPVRLGFFLGIREVVGEGHDQFVDDLYTSRDGRLLVVSRPSLADVVAIKIKTGEIAWRFPVAGQRSDHMGLSPDGKHVAVSASTGNVVHILDIRTGDEVGQFDSGDSPHENNYSTDGERIYHASIGLVYTPADRPEFDSTKGDRWFEVVDVDAATDGDDETDPVLERIDMGQKLAEAGYPDMSAAVRPMAISPDEKRVYFQVSFFHGFVEYNFKRGKVTRVANLPIAEHVQGMPREEYILDSAHHGMAMNPEGTKLCAAGTMSDYAAIVSRKTFNYKLIHGGMRPYWSTNSGDGRYCFVSWSQTDNVSAISYKKEEEIASVPVGDHMPTADGIAHPQRMRMGQVRAGWLRKQR